MAQKTYTYDPNKRYWKTPNKRAEGYVSELKSGVHERGAKKGQQLTDNEIRIRRGYLQCQSDHAGAYRYSEALSNGMSKKDAAEYSRQKRSKKN